MNEDLLVIGDVYISEPVIALGEVRTNTIDAGVTKIVINGEEQEVLDGTVSFTVPTHTSELVNDSDFTDTAIVSQMISNELVAYQKKLYVLGDTLIAE